MSDRLPQLLLGDNPLLGVNHSSQTRAEHQGKRFTDSSKILSLLESARDAGFGAIMCTVHEKLVPVFREMERHQCLSDWPVLPSIPYAQKYNAILGNRGVGGLIGEIGLGGTLRAVWTAVLTTVGRSPMPLMKALIDHELRNLKGLSFPVVFLQNTATDLLVGLQAGELLKEYADHVSKKHGARPGFVTFNPEALLSLLDSTVFERRPVVCLCANPIGFRMFPTQSSVERTIKSYSGIVEFVAMSTLASGRIPVDRAAAYISSLDGIASVVAGSSRVDHLHALSAAFCNAR